MDADEIYSHLQDACDDCARDTVMEFNEGGCWDAETTALLKKAKRNGITDLEDWYSDHLYNDESALSDLLGDRIHDAGTDSGTRRNIVTQLADMRSDTAWNNVFKKFKARKW